MSACLVLLLLQKSAARTGLAETEVALLRAARAAGLDHSAEQARLPRVA